MRNFILNSRKGSKALSTPESILSGLVAGKPAQGLPMFRFNIFYLYRLCDFYLDQSDLGSPDYTDRTEEIC